mgnify:CR=1 FL=1
MTAVHIDKVKYNAPHSLYFPTDRRCHGRFSPFGSSITKDVLHCIAFGLQKTLFYPHQSHHILKCSDSCGAFPVQPDTDILGQELIS